MSEDKQSAIAKVTHGPGGLELRTFADVWSFAQCLVKSGMAPPGLDTVEQVVIAIEMGAEIGLKAMQAVQGIAVINRKPCVYGDSMLGTCQASAAWDHGVFSEWYTGEYPNDDFTAHCRVGRVGAEYPVECSFSVADAKQASLWGKSGPWTSYTKRQMMWRARTWSCRNAFADVLKGLTVAEEAQDFAAVIDAPQTASLPAQSRGDAIAALAAPSAPVSSTEWTPASPPTQPGSLGSAVPGPTDVVVPPSTPAPAPTVAPVERSAPEAVDTPQEAPETITYSQWEMLLGAYNGLDTIEKPAVRKSLGFQYIDDLKTLPADQFEEVMVELNAAHILPDKPVDAVEAEPTATPVDDAKPAILAGHEFAEVKAAYDALDVVAKQNFRAFAFGSANTMFTDLAKRPVSPTYTQLMAWLNSQKGGA